MWGEVGGALVLLLLLSEVLDCIGISPPGKPVLINCRSPEKETFTCRWEPGFDGGLPTTQHLYYQKEDSDGMYECPDYQTAGSNSCFFNKSHTSIWVNYNITVVAINSLGSTVSDPLEVDVMYIVQPNAPENVTVSVVETEESPHLLVKWDPPHEADTRSGWITLTYQLRVKRQNKKDKWEEYASGKQTQLIIYSLHPGEVYMVQVRCELDHSLWSEWSTTIHTEVPDYTLKERSIWIVVAVFSAFILLLVTFTLAMKRKYVKLCLLPPVPGPKISGLDTQLLKSGRSDDILSSLINQGFPPTMATKDQQVDYLLVFDSEQVTPDLQNGQTRTKNSIDHGRHDHSLLMEAKNKEVKVDGGRETVEQGNTEGLESTFRNTKSLSTDVTAHPCPQKKPFNNVTETPKQAPVSSKHRSLSHHKDLWDSLARQHLDYRETVVKSQSNCDDKHNLSSQNIVTPSKDIGYVEVQRWKKSIGLQVLVPEVDQRQEDYSKVSVVENDNVVLLKRETVPLNCTSCKVRGNQSEKCLHQKPCKPHITVPAKEGVHIGSNGYVEPVTISHIL
ncbi:unnamed protein product [Coregonus sp. 'balchen']|uniref:Prolactin receptor n=1 Tax=Coregonus suidteri TaxID=861788 RepID=A0AAN8LXQ5_9TELE|nr:unnamed protein product [Coregonus sp. 'balchen']